MEDKKTYYIEKYKELKALKNGVKPLRNEFLEFCKIQIIRMEKIFGRDPYSKLQKESGDDPNKLSMEGTPLIDILHNYGLLVRKHQQNIVIADWLESNYSPSPDSIRKVHKLKWSQLPNAFAEIFKDKNEWTDVLEILGKSDKPKPNSNKLFDDIITQISKWNPDRKRSIEEGYKIEIRNYLEKYFTLEEEVGETNPDILISKKYPIEIKRDPTQSEYDRLMGQMIRHNKYYGSAIAIITSISSQDRFKKFQKLFIEIHDKLEMKAELFCK